MTSKKKSLGSNSDNKNNESLSSDSLLVSGKFYALKMSIAIIYGILVYYILQYWSFLRDIDYHYHLLGGILNNIIFFGGFITLFLGIPYLILSIFEDNKEWKNHKRKLFSYFGTSIFLYIVTAALTYTINIW